MHESSSQSCRMQRSRYMSASAEVSTPQTSSTTLQGIAAIASLWCLLLTSPILTHRVIASSPMSSRRATPSTMRSAMAITVSLMSRLARGAGCSSGRSAGELQACGSGSGHGEEPGQLAGALDTDVGIGRVRG